MQHSRLIVVSANRTFWCAPVRGEVVRPEARERGRALLRCGSSGALPPRPCDTPAPNRALTGVRRPRGPQSVSSSTALEGECSVAFYSVSHLPCLAPPALGCVARNSCSAPDSKRRAKATQTQLVHPKHNKSVYIHI